MLVRGIVSGYLCFCEGCIRAGNLVFVRVLPVGNIVSVKDVSKQVTLC